MTKISKDVKVLYKNRRLIQKWSNSFWKFSRRFFNS